MIWRYPEALALLVLVPLAEWWRCRRAARPALHFSDTKLLARLPSTWTVGASAALPWLRGIGVALLVVALAGPRRGLSDSAVRTDAVDIVLVMDVSPSMAAEDFSTRSQRLNRLDAAKRVVADFIRRRPNDRLGLVVFAAWPYTASPLTLDHAWLEQRVAELHVGMVGDGTAIGSALGSAVNRLRESTAKSKVVVLLTDGMNNAGALSPDDAAQAAAAMSVRVYTIGAGTRGMAPVPVRSPFGGVQYIQQPVEIDEALLQRMAAATGGRYFRATDLEGLEEIYRQIDALEKTEIEARQYTRFEERFAPWAAAGALALAIELALSLGRLGRLPA